MRKHRVLFIVGTHNQTSMMHQISEHFDPMMYDCRFTTYYGDGWQKTFAERGWLEMTIVGQSTQRANRSYYDAHQLREDYRGASGRYDLVYLCQDAIVPHNILSTNVILVQEGTLMPKDWRYHMVKGLHLPRWLADTSLLGLSHCYKYFCVASEGYREELIKRGVKPETLQVTGIPNFDHVQRYADNDFPHRDFVLVATSNLRESKRKEDRKGYIRKAVEIANGQKLIFKLHPMEDHDRAIREIKSIAPESIIYKEGSIEQMIVHCDALITRYSSVILVAAAMGKKIYTEEYTPAEIAKLSPIQNGGTSAHAIAQLGKSLLPNHHNKKRRNVRTANGVF